MSIRKAFKKFTQSLSTNGKSRANLQLFFNLVFLVPEARFSGAYTNFPSQITSKQIFSYETLNINFWNKHRWRDDAFVYQALFNFKRKKKSIF